MAESPIDKYLHTCSLEQSSWRSVALFGKNTASYKFALALSLMHLAQQGRDSVVLAARICEHAKAAPRQSTNRSKKFLDACLGRTGVHRGGRRGRARLQQRSQGPARVV